MLIETSYPRFVGSRLIVNQEQATALKNDETVAHQSLSTIDLDSAPWQRISGISARVLPGLSFTVEQ